MPQYKTYNAPMPTTAAIVKVTTGTAIKTLLQLSTPATRGLTVLSWGFSIDAAPATTGVGVVELVDTSTVAATVTAHTSTGIIKLDPNSTASLLTLGVGNTGYTGSAEGSITATRVLDAEEIAGVSNGAMPIAYSYQFLPDERPIVPASSFLRVRVTFSAAVNALCWVVWDE